MFKILRSFMHIRALTNSALPTFIKCIISRAKCIGFLSGLWSMIYFTNVYLIKGIRKSSNLKLTTLVFGDINFSHYFANLVCSVDYEIVTLKKTTYYNIPKIIDRRETDVIVVQADRALSRFLSRQGFLILPKIHFTLNVSTPEKLFAGMSRLRRRNINRIKKHGFAYEITREPHKLDFFYNKLYLPYISKRHGRSANLVSFFTMKQLYRKGGLLLVKLGKEYVSGILYSIFNHTVSACCLGIYEGKKQHLDEGACHAALYFLAEWSRLQGFKEIDYGHCNPFVNDGLFTYKRSWGMKVKPCRDLAYGLRISELNPSVVEFLFENPLVFVESENLSGLIFRKVDRETTEVFRVNSYYTPGLSRIVVAFHPVGDLSALSSKPSEEGFTKKVDIDEATPVLFKLWTKHGGEFYQKEYSP